MEFNPELYEFMKERQTCLWVENEQVKFGIHVDYGELVNFIDVIGDHNLDDGGFDATMNLNNKISAYVELQDIFEWSNLRLKDYKYCFEHDVFERCSEAIEKFDGD